MESRNAEEYKIEFPDRSLIHITIRSICGNALFNKGNKIFSLVRVTVHQFNKTVLLNPFVISKKNYFCMLESPSFRGPPDFAHLLELK